MGAREGMANLLLPFFLLTKMPLYGEGGHYGTNSDECLTPTEREPALLCGLCDLPVKFPVSPCLSMVKFPPLRLRLQTASVFS